MKISNLLIISSAVIICMLFTSCRHSYIIVNKTKNVHPSVWVSVEDTFTCIQNVKTGVRSEVAGNYGNVGETVILDITNF